MRLRASAAKVQARTGIHAGVFFFVLHVQASCAKGAGQVKIDGRMSGGTPFVSNVGCEQNVYFITRECVRGCVFVFENHVHQGLNALASRLI